MKQLVRRSITLLSALAATAASAHPGHGFGPFGHDLQHQLWIFGALVVVAAACMWALSRNKDQQ